MADSTTSWIARAMGSIQLLRPGSPSLSKRRRSGREGCNRGGGRKTRRCPRGFLLEMQSPTKQYKVSFSCEPLPLPWHWERIAFLARFFGNPQAVGMTGVAVNILFLGPHDGHLAIRMPSSGKRGNRPSTSEPSTSGRPPCRTAALDGSRSPTSTRPSSCSPTTATRTREDLLRASRQDDGDRRLQGRGLPRDDGDAGL